MSGPIAWIVAVIAATVGYMVPGLILGRLITKQKRRIENGLPDALDLMIVCVEAGCGLDQAILKTSEELEISHPGARVGAAPDHDRDACRQAPHRGVQELRAPNASGRRARARRDAGADRSVRHEHRRRRCARTPRRRAPSGGSAPRRGPRRSASSSCSRWSSFCFPAFYVVTLGPAVIQFVRVFFGQVVNQ